MERGKESLTTRIICLVSIPLPGIIKWKVLYVMIADVTYEFQSRCRESLNGKLKRGLGLQLLYLFQSRCRESLNGKLLLESKRFAIVLVSIPLPGIIKWKDQSKILLLKVWGVSIPLPGIIKWKGQSR